jgi:plastocyanin
MGYPLRKEVMQNAIATVRSHAMRVTAAAAVVTAAVAVAASAAAASSSAAPKTVTGTVGPGFTIGLTMNGKKVTKLKAGVPYRFVVSDRSPEHNFHLFGPGLSRVVTTVEGTGTKTFTLKLKKGAYHYQCDPHASFMHGSFAVA